MKNQFITRIAQTDSPRNNCTFKLAEKGWCSLTQRRNLILQVVLVIRDQGKTTQNSAFAVSPFLFHLFGKIGHAIHVELCSLISNVFEVLERNMSTVVNERHL